MKIDRNPQYHTIAIYACIVAACTVLCIFLGIHISEVFDGISKIINLFTPLIIGFALAYLLNPLVKFLETHVFRLRRKEHGGRTFSKLRRALSITAAYLLFTLLISFLAALVIPQVVLSYHSFMNRSDRYLSTLESWIRTLGERYSFINIDRAISYLNDLADNWYQILQSVIPHIAAFFSAFFAQLRNVLLGVVLSAYFLASKEKLGAQFKKIMYAFLPRRHGDRLLAFLRFTDKTFGGFIIGKLVDSLIVGLLTLAVLAAFGVPYYQLVSVIVGVTDIIPFFGPFIGAIPGALIIFFVDPGKAVLFVILIIIIQQLDGNVISPRILGQRVGLSSLGVILAITICGGLFGFAGMLLGVPLFALLYVGFSRLLKHRMNTREPTGTAAKESAADATAGKACENSPREEGRAECTESGTSQTRDEASARCTLQNDEGKETRPCAEIDDEISSQ